MSGVLGVIGGSGLYAMDALERVEETNAETPFGAPSSPVVSGMLGEQRILFLTRHGRGHTIAPTQINYRANVYALKALGATHLLSVSAVGSLREELAPGHVVLPSQLLDRTTRRISTFFDDGVVAHVAMADPYCSLLSEVVADAAGATGAVAHRDKTYVCIEGPRFSDAGRESCAPRDGRRYRRNDRGAGGIPGPRGGATVRHDGARGRTTTAGERAKTSTSLRFLPSSAPTSRARRRRSRASCVSFPIHGEARRMALSGTRSSRARQFRPELRRRYAALLGE